MIDSRLIENLPSHVRPLVAAAMSTLFQVGIIPRQMTENEARLLSGSSDQDPQELAREILQFRAKQQLLQEFHNLTHVYYKEQTNA